MLLSLVFKNLFLFFIYYYLSILYRATGTHAKHDSADYGV